MVPLDAHLAQVATSDAQEWLNDSVAPDSFDLPPLPIDHTNLWRIVYVFRPVQIDSSRGSESGSRSDSFGSLDGFISQTDSDADAEPIEDNGNVNYNPAVYGISHEILARQGAAVRAVREGTSSNLIAS